jgi:hypothetical protein
MSTQLTASERDATLGAATRLKQGNWQEWCDLDREIEAIIRPERKRAAQRLRRLILELLPEGAQMALFSTAWQLGTPDLPLHAPHMPRDMRKAGGLNLNSHAPL